LESWALGHQRISPEALQQLLEISSEREDDKPATVKFDTHHVYMQFLGHTMKHADHANVPQLSLNKQHLLELVCTWSG
jgi:hypothetical protein